MVKENGTTTWLTAPQVAAQLKFNASWIRHLCQEGRIQGAMKLGTAWMIPDPPVILSKIGVGMVTAAEAARILNLSRERVGILCRLGHIKGAVRKEGAWAIPLPIERLRGRPGRRAKEEVPA